MALARPGGCRTTPGTPRRRGGVANCEGKPTSPGRRQRRPRKERTIDAGRHPFRQLHAARAPGTLRPTLAATARIAEQGGCAVFTLMDHWFQMEQFATAQDPMLEGYTSLGYLAGKTEQMKLGLLVTGVTYRHPGLLAKIVTTLDVLSGGRAQLGIGAAWYEREHLGLGVPFPPVCERFERLEEALQICQQMWGDDDGPYEGRHYQLAETICAPPPISNRDRGSSSGGRGAKDPPTRRPVRRCLQPLRLVRSKWPTSSTYSPPTATPKGGTRRRSRAPSWAREPARRPRRVSGPDGPVQPRSASTPWRSFRWGTRRLHDPGLVNVFVPALAQLAP